jgi:endoglucanase
MSRGPVAFLIAFLPVCLAQTERPTTAIRVDQAGYPSKASKVALVAVSASSNNAPVSFVLKNGTTGATVFQGQLAPPVTDPDSGDMVRAADFSKFGDNGRFYLQAAGIGRSWTFRIAPDVYRPVYFLSMRAFYGQRCGTAVDLAPDFPEYKHALCHRDGAYDSSAGKQGRHGSDKGWHDAGDYGRYVVNGGISTGTLLWAWELFHVNIEKVTLHIPESGNGTPDILSEIRWNLDWILSMQDSDGGVFHKQTRAHFSGFVMPEQDTLPSLVIGTGNAPFKGSCATADLAAVSAIAARAFRPYDAHYADRALGAAEKAWAWLVQNPNVTFRNPPGIATGEYGDAHCEDEHLWAAAELARTTHSDVYKQYFLQHYREFIGGVRADKPPTWSDVADLALWTYVLAGFTDEPAREIRSQSLDAAHQIAERTQANPYHVSLRSADYIWGSNAVALNYSLQLLIANQFQPERAFVEAATDNLHYVLGCNTFSLSWITHVGENAFQHPHHRPSGADGIDAPWPGLMSGGPNAKRQDPVMRRTVDLGTPPARAYIDETQAYSCNEVAINWNAPLVFVLASFAY